MFSVRKIVPIPGIIVLMIVTTTAFPWEEDAPQSGENKTDTQIFQKRRMIPSAVGGKIAELEDFPWTAMLLYSFNDTEMIQNGCGGALINRNFVITAAHCVVDRKNTKRPLKFVRLREYDIHNDPDCMIESNYIYCSEEKIDTEPRNITIHPGYNVSDRNSYHDIALIEIDPTPPYSDFLQPIYLPEPEMNNGVTVGKEFIVSGWGRTDIFTSQLGRNALSPIKLKVVLPYVERETCKRMLTSDYFELGSGQICAGGEFGMDTCGGDSGSPLMHYDVRNEVWVLTGIVSVGIRDCGTLGVPGVYTNVREYLMWIKHSAGMVRSRSGDVAICG